MKRNIYNFAALLLIMSFFSAPVLVNGQAIKKEILQNYTEEDYQIFLQKERNGEIPAQGGVISSRSTGDVLVNNNSGATTSGQFTQSETSILAFGSNVVVGYNDAGSFNGGANKFTGWSYSSDGGATFTDGGTLPTNPGGDAGDPVLVRDDVSGQLYFSTLQFSNGNGIPIYRSNDNGQTWSLPTQGAPGMSGFADKQWIAVDNFTGTGQGNVYLIVRDFGYRNGIYFYSSTDNGATFGPNGGTLITNGFQGAFVVVGSDHSVYAFWWNSSTLQMRKSTDFGATFGTPVTVASGLSGPQINGGLGLTGIRQGLGFASGFRSNSFPHAAVNPVSGHIYVTYNDNPAGADKGDIFMVMSTDGGATWSAPTRINDDGGTTDQWQPTIVVTPDGNNLGIFYYSREGDAADNNLFTYNGRNGIISGSTVTFPPSYVVSDVMSIPEFGRDNVVNSTYMGDYNQAAATNTDFHLVWSDNRDDLTGGGDRKDPNVYHKSVPVGVLSGANIAASPLDVDFGGTPINSSSDPLQVTIVNIGDADLTVSAITDPTPDFSASYPSLPAVIPSLGSITIDVSFAPVSLGAQSSSIDITSNAVNSPLVTVNLSGFGALENDYCYSAYPFPTLICDDVTVSGSTTDATVDTEVGLCGTSVTAPGVWYTVEGTGSEMTASTCNQANYDTKISVFIGDCETLACIGGLDDSPGCAGFTTEYSWPSVIGVTYYVLVHGFGEETGDFDLTISHAGLPPEIAVSPLELNFIVPVDGSDDATLSISNTGECSIDLNWFISEGEYVPASPTSSSNMTFEYNSQPFGNSSPNQELQYFIDQSTMDNLEADGLFSKYPVRNQLLIMMDKKFDSKKDFYQTLSLTLGEQYKSVALEVKQYAKAEKAANTGLAFNVDETDADMDENNGQTQMSSSPSVVLDNNYRPQMAMSGNVLYDNGPLVNSPGTGVGGADESVLQNLTLGMNYLGFGHQVPPIDNRISDEFTVTDPNGWQVDSLLFYSYQSNAPNTSTVVGVYYEIWDGPPNDPGSNIVFGDLSTNRLINTEWSNIYRVTETTAGTNSARAIMANTVSTGINLPPATYWIVWQTEGSSSYSGPWAPPITINGVTTTGNAGQSLNGGVWNEALDSGTGTPQGFPFLVYGESLDYCTWLVTAPNIGFTASGTSSDANVAVDATGLAVDFYYCNLVINSNAINENLITVPVTMVVGTPLERIDLLIAKVEALEDAGVLNKGNTNALIKKLQNAKKSIQKGNCNAAVNQLNAFINQVNAFINSGKLTDEQGNELIECANVIIGLLQPCEQSGPLAGTDSEFNDISDVGYSLDQNRPNPFNGKTTISFSVLESNHTTLVVYNSVGQEVAVLFNDVAQSDNQYSFEFDGSSRPKGIYFYHLKSGEKVNTMKKMILIK